MKGEFTSPSVASIWKLHFVLPGLTVHPMASIPSHVQSSWCGSEGRGGKRAPCPGSQESQRRGKVTETQTGEGTVGEFGMDMYTLLYLKWITNKDYGMKQGSLLDVMWQPGWAGSLAENGYVWPSPFGVRLKLSRRC